MASPRGEPRPPGRQAHTRQGLLMDGLGLNGASSKIAAPTAGIMVESRTFLMDII
ncbi:MAG: hypothetical protein LBJ61_06115 [Deltaproteobacteria bacterium]|nr:hypothetical protein [Deltaproteobacteria bacterium]